jgi:hypothetical protein
MENPYRFRLPLIVQCLLFLIPVNIYIVGDWIAVGVQWIFFRYQQCYVENHLSTILIFFTKDLYYVQEGILKGRSAVAAEVGVFATFIMILAFLLLILAYIEENGTWVKAAAITSITGGCLYLVSDMIQYGILFNGPAGFTIPIGVPIILVCGWWMYRMKFPEIENERSDDKAVSEKKETYDD